MLEDTLNEIRQIPEEALECYQKNKNVKLPQKIPYLGMGASFNPLLALFYAGVDFYPFIASEYYYYLYNNKTHPLGVIISQSGKSKEALLSRACFDNYIAVTNDADSSLARGKNIKDLILLHAGKETSISSKTYINTLIVLYQGLGFDVKSTLEELNNRFNEYEAWGENRAEAVCSFVRKHNFRSFYIIGSGPNLATAKQGALTASEATKLGINGMSLGQYDHGPKETAHHSVVVLIDVEGKTSVHTRKMIAKLQSISDCLLIRLEIKNIEEVFSPLHAIIPINFLTCHLAGKMGVAKIYEVGDKVVES